ncbi:hypothetical protein MAMMFC1_00321 [Methylomusa anaerophila]|uniref:Uncharacterized protein n=1 Tax=Methylomusa anaerophila TaxID=1930071 RepID=A0A348AF40_9FIRM|nr:hypothetical protein MAMMFC1_00321 [Methylomusa anaerophila]
MKTIRLLFKNSHNVVTISFEQIIQDCRSNPTELDIMRVLKKMEQDNEITIIPFRKHR